MVDQTSKGHEVQEAAETVAAAAAEASWLQTRVILRVIFVVLAVAAGLWMLYALEGVLLLVVLSTFFAYLIAPLVEFVRRPFKFRGREHIMPRVLAIGIVYLLIFGSIGITVYLLLPRLGNQINQFAKQRKTYSDILEGRRQALNSLVGRLGLPQEAQAAVVDSAPRVISAAQEYGREALSSMAGWIAYVPWLVLIPILAFFLLKDADSFRRAALQTLPYGRLRWRGDEFFQDVNRTLAAYIRAQLIACLFIGVVCTMGFYLIRVPYALVLGIIAGMLEFIPLAGPFTVLLIAAVIASFESIGQMLAVIAFLVVLRIVHDYFIYPRIIGQGIHLHPLAVVLAILCGEELAGLAGIFLAIPLIAVISVTYRHWLEHRGSTGLVADLFKPVEQAVTAPASPANAPLPPAPLKPPANTPAVSAPSPATQQ